MVAGRTLRSVKLTQQRKPHKPGPPALNVAGTFASALAAVALAASGTVSGAATAVSLSGPATGVAGQASTYTVSLNGASGNVTVTIAANGLAGTLSTPTVLVNTGSPTATFTFTPASAGSGTLSITNNAGLANLGSPLAITASSPSAFSTTFQVTSSSTLTAAPFTFGHAFRQGDVPAGQVANAGVSGLSDWQCIPTSTWPADGSLRHAIVSGRANLSATVPLTLSITAGTPGAGTALTETDLAAGLASLSIAAGGFTWDVKASIGTADRQRTVCTGPVMSNFIYRKPVAGSNHLVLWCDLRVYKGGQVEVFPWVENAYFLVANPTNDLRTYTVTLNGSQVFSASIDAKHHTRPALISTSVGPSFSYWTGTNPQVTPKHNSDYLIDTRMVPNWGFRSPSATVLNGLQQTFTPNTLSSIDANMGNAGTAAGICNREEVFYGGMGDARAWKASQVFALSGGSWSVHYRSELTNEPFSFLTYPNASLQVQDTPLVPVGTGAENGTPDIAHQPSFGYLAWLVSGRWWFLDEVLMWGGYNYLQQTVPNRQNAGSVIRSDAGANQDRGAAWGLRTIAQGLAILPGTHPLFTALKGAWEANMNFYANQFTASNGARGSNVLGVQGWYTNGNGYTVSVYQQGFGGGSNYTTFMYGPGFEQEYIHGVFGFTWDLALPVSAAGTANHQLARDFSYIFPTSAAGDGLNGHWSFQNFVIYACPWGIINQGYQPSWDAIWSAYKAGFSLTGAYTNQLYDHSSATPLSPASSSIPYFNSALNALSHAVDHGFAGAASGWNRIADALNFTSWTEANLHDLPVDSVVPRQPSWVRGAPINQWVEIQGSSMAANPPSLNPGGSGSINAIIEGWDSLSIDTRSCRVWSVANGGHDDTWCNAVLYLDLLRDSPRWFETLASSPAGVVTFDQAYYSDGRPASTHSYYNQHFIEARNRAIRFGAGAHSKSGNASSNVDGFDCTLALGANGWDAAGTYPNVPSYGRDMPMVKNTLTEDIYHFNDNLTVHKWTQATNTWSQVSSSNPGTGFLKTVGAYDSSRNRILLVGGAVPAGTCYTYDLATNQFTQRTLAGAQVGSVGQQQQAMVYEPVLDKFLLRSKGGGTEAEGGPNVYTIDAGAFTTGLLATTGGSTIPSSVLGTQGGGSPYSKFLRVPRFRGVVWIPSYVSNAWFLRTH